MRVHRVLVLACCVGLSALAAQPRATIALLPHANIGSEFVSLGDVAHLSSPDLALMRSLVNLPIGRVPRPGQPAMVSRQALAQWLRRQAGLGAEQIEWRGADVAQVQRITRQVAGQEIAAVAADAVVPVVQRRGRIAAVGRREGRL